MSNSPTLPPDDRSDAELASLVARRDPSLAVQSFQSLHARYAPRLVSYLATRLDRAVVETSAREIWQGLWNALGNPDEFDGQDFSTLILQKSQEVLDGPGRATIRQPDASRADGLARSLAALHPGERVVVEFRLGGLTFEEIATRAKSTSERARKVFETARKKLNASLEPEQT